MFRTEVNHFLQSFDSQALYQFLKYVSFLGTAYMLILVVLAVIGAVNFRKGIIVLNILGWSSLAIVGAKQFFDYPRPIAVDPALESFGEPKTSIDLTSMQPTGFFNGFNHKVLTITRSSTIGRYGFPSGHVAIITAIWFGVAMLFNRKWLWWVSAVLVFLTAISRMYLGVHYLGDVLGGLTLGVLLVLLFNLILRKTELSKGVSFKTGQTIFFLAPMILIPFFKFVPAFMAGGLIGFNLAAIIIFKRWGEAQLSEAWWKRVINTLIITFFYFAAFFLLKNIHIGKTGILPMLVNTITYTSVLMASFVIGKSLKLYR